MKIFKKLLIYLAFILGGLVVIALGIFAFMYFSPNTPVLGLEYVLYKEENIKTYNLNTDPSVSGVKAVEIITDMTDIYIYPNAKSNEIIVQQNQHFSGLVKHINADLSLDTKIQTKSFEEKTNSLKTFSVISDEPSGWISKKTSHIAVYIPNNLAIDTIYARSNSGNVYYASNGKDDSKLQCTNLYLKTFESGFVSISNKEAVSNYYLSTGSGGVKFNETESITANTIKFSTNSGSLKITNKSAKATLNLTDGLYVTSTDKRHGSSVIINKLNGNLYVDAVNGQYEIDQIGNSGQYKTVAMSLKKSQIKFGKVYGQISLLSDTSVSQNDVTIDSLIYKDGQTSILETGKGSVKINNLDAHLAVDSTKGNININNAKVTSSIYTYSTSGDVNIKYKDYDSSEELNVDANLKVITETGNINLSNVSCLLEIQVRGSSDKPSLNVSFNNVATNSEKNNIINAYNRKVNLKLIGFSDYLQFRIASTHAVDIKEGTVATDISNVKDSNGVINNDHLLNLPAFKDYSHCYRVGYTKNDNSYEKNSYELWGKLCIKTTNKITLEAISR